MSFVTPQRQVHCKTNAAGFTLSFFAMASPCEVLIECDDEYLAKHIGDIVANEAWRIQDKYSRYDANSVCALLNKQAGHVCDIDQETYDLLAFADKCYQMSDGLFDITSGVLRKAWQFDGSDNVPLASDIAKLMPLMGWQHVELSHNSIKSQFRMAQGMEIDLGGLGKEYAVDRALQLAMLACDCPMLINFGGDLAVSKVKTNQQAWQVGIEHPSFSADKTVIVSIKSGAIATSGDANRFLLKNGQRYSHILNVKTGWPVENPPNAITVAAPQCIQAGFLATLALLQGVNAEQFLAQQEIKHWAIR